ncbi:MAG: glycosyltransferase [Crocosphaera sp.]
MIKLTFLVRDLNVGGAQKQLISLLKALNKDKFEITLLTLYSGGVLEKELHNTNVALISLDKTSRWDVLEFFGKLIRTINGIKPDIIHGYLGLPNLLTMLLKPLFPKTKIVWGVRASNQDFRDYNWLLGVIFKLECWLSSFADLIIVNSYAGKNYHLKCGFPSDKMVVIPNGIDHGHFRPDTSMRIKIRKTWGISEDTILIGLVGRLDPMKDHSNFLKAAMLLSQERKNIRFVCVGKGPEKYAKQLYQLSDELKISDKVLWVGERNDMPAIYNSLDIACSSSSYGEGFPNVIGEAMACGVPCVVTDVGDSAWVVGDIGVVVPPKNPQAMACGWKSCLEMDRKEISKQSRARIIENFSIQNLVDKTESSL